CRRLCTDLAAISRNHVSDHARPDLIALDILFGWHVRVVIVAGQGSQAVPSLVDYGNRKASPNGRYLSRFLCRREKWVLEQIANDPWLALLHGSAATLISDANLSAALHVLLWPARSSQRLQDRMGGIEHE